MVYKTATSPFFPSVFTVICNSGRFPKMMAGKIKPKKMLAIINDGVANWFFSRDIKKTAEAIFSKIYSSPTLFNKMKTKEKEIFKKLSREIKFPVEKLFVGKILTKKGEAKLRRIFQLYWDYGEFIDAPGFLFQVYLTDDFKKEIFASLKNSQNKEEIFNYLLASYKFTNYEKFLFSLLKAAKDGKNSRKVAKKLAAKYFWLVHDYLGNIVNERYVQKKLRELPSDSGHLIKRYEQAKERVKKIKEIKKELPAGILRKAQAVQEILYLYSERKKEILNQVNIFLRRIFEYKYPHLTVSGLRRLFQIMPEEAIMILKNEFIPELAQRNKRWVYVIEDGKITRGSEKYFTLVNGNKVGGALQGLAACGGKVKGRISMVLNVSQIGKFQKGNILAAPYTNVSYLPIMHQAKAILTETGGLTSHAAIVARELNKPSVVGVKGLLSNVKDGDWVEVDANKGVVKKL